MGELQSLLIDVDVNVNFVFYAAALIQQGWQQLASGVPAAPFRKTGKPEKRTIVLF
jgi:hypothetical protein